MRTTSSFEVFPNEPTERDLARARWLRKEGRLSEAEEAYRGVMATQPALRSGWTECFELLRSVGKIDDALVLATAARDVFSTEAFPLTLEGAALIELGKLPQALVALENAVQRDPDLALTWHELGYAAYRLGDGNRALAALDRAFALEPHTETLLLRGKILRDAGEFYAAEVAFEGALHSAAHKDQEGRIQNEIFITRRRGAFTPAWVEALTEAQEWFATHGTLVLGSDKGETPPSQTDLVAALAKLRDDRQWQFGQIVVQSKESCGLLFQTFGVPITTWDLVDTDLVPLAVAPRPMPEDPKWQDACKAIEDGGRGLTLILAHPIDVEPEVDVVGSLEVDGKPLPLIPDSSTALVMAQHPAARLADRLLNTE